MLKLSGVPASGHEPDREQARLWQRVDVRGELLGRLPWWAAVLLVWLGSRVVSSVILLVFGSFQGPSEYGSAHPGLVAVADQWDARWYQTVAEFGYPSQLPHDALGNVTENDWAFMPLYPGVVRLLMTLTGLGFDPVALFVSLACGLGSVFVLYALIRQRWSGSRSLWFVAAFCVAPVAPLLQTDYAESMMMLLLFAALLAIVQRRYLLSMAPIVAMSFTRPSGVAMALCLGLVLLWRWGRRGRDPLSIVEAVRIVVAAVVAGLAGLAWPVVAGVVTGVSDAYTQTELRWSSYYTGTQQLAPFTPWFSGIHWWFLYLGLPEAIDWLLAIAIVFGLIAVLVLLLRAKTVRSLPMETWLWTVSWSVYLLAVFFPQSSSFRLLMPAFPLLAVAIGSPRLSRRVLGLVILTILQIGWVWACWYIVGRDWTPP